MGLRAPQPRLDGREPLAIGGQLLDLTEAAIQAAQQRSLESRRGWGQAVELPPLIAARFDRAGVPQDVHESTGSIDSSHGAIEIR
jgi:hypothetical protein